MHFSYLTPSNPFLKILIPALAIVLVMVSCKKQHITASDLLLKKPILRYAIIWSVVDLSYMLLTDYFLNWRGDFDFTPWQNQPLFTSFARILAVVVLGPIAEELIFRGLLFTRLTRLVKNEWISMVIIAVVWAFLHIEYDLGTDLIIMGEGLILGAAMLQSRSLYVPIWLHIAWNLYAVW